ncbi:unnamed protein product [Peniophora sp. CBMAI 1063]|nr:unnamed protein product [Peniophora sp. CBMAI 1063]
MPPVTRSSIRTKPVTRSAAHAMLVNMRRRAAVTSRSSGTRTAVTDEDMDLVAAFRKEVGFKPWVRWASLLDKVPHHRDRPTYWRYVDRYHRHDILARVDALKRKAGAHTALPSRRRTARSSRSGRAPTRRTTSCSRSTAPKRAARSARAIAHPLPTADKAATQRLERAARSEVRNARRNAAALDLQQGRDDAGLSPDPTPPPSPRSLSVELLDAPDVKPLWFPDDQRHLQVFDGIEEEIEAYLKIQAAEHFRLNADS